MYLVFLQGGEVGDSFPADLQSCGVYAGDIYSTRRNYGNWNKQEDTVMHSDSNHYHHHFAHLKTFYNSKLLFRILRQCGKILFPFV